MGVYRRDIYETEYMSSLIKDEEFLENFIEVWKKSQQYHQKRI